MTAPWVGLARRVLPRGRMIHVAITRTIRPGREAEFRARLERFFAEAEASGPTQAYFIGPAVPGSRDYGVLRAFEDERARDAFYASELYARWNAEVADLVEGEPDRRPLHGLEAFFRGPPAANEPPAYKMALVTWLGVNPAVYIFANGVPAVAPGLPPLVELAVVNAFVVASLTWAFMPVLTRLFGGWLRAE